MRLAVPAATPEVARAGRPGDPDLKGPDRLRGDPQPEGGRGWRVSIGGRARACTAHKTLDKQGLVIDCAPIVARPCLERRPSGACLVKPNCLRSGDRSHRTSVGLGEANALLDDLGYESSCCVMVPRVHSWNGIARGVSNYLRMFE